MFVSFSFATTINSVSPNMYSTCKEILCLIQIKQNGEFLVATEKDTNHHIFYLGKEEIFTIDASMFKRFTFIGRGY
jgi:hypothetical protein